MSRLTKNEITKDIFQAEEKWCQMIAWTFRKKKYKEQMKRQICRYIIYKEWNTILSKRKATLSR